jgi:hypothetical protein
VRPRAGRLQSRFLVTCKCAVGIVHGHTLFSSMVKEHNKRFPWDIESSTVPPAVWFPCGSALNRHADPSHPTPRFQSSHRCGSPRMEELWESTVHGNDDPSSLLDPRLGPKRRLIARGKKEVRRWSGSYAIVLLRQGVHRDSSSRSQHSQMAKRGICRARGERAIRLIRIRNHRLPTGYDHGSVRLSPPSSGVRPYGT